VPTFWRRCSNDGNAQRTCLSKKRWHDQRSTGQYSKNIFAALWDNDRYRVGAPGRRPVWGKVANDGFGCAPCKGGAFQWVKILPGELLQPEAPGATMEVTKWLKPLGKACHEIR
jgi:hypothetical protein